MSWTACTDGYCRDHYTDKAGAGWFPKKRKARKLRELVPKLEREGASLADDESEQPKNGSRSHSRTVVEGIKRE